MGKICTRCKKEHEESTKWCSKCKVRHAAYIRDYSSPNPQAEIKRRLSWRLRNPEKVKQTRQKWLENNKERLLAATRRWVARNPGKVRENNLKRYGLTREDYTDMLEEQNGVCATDGCGASENLCVDHNHATGKVRQLLCSRCNHALGHARESKDILLGLVAYIERHSS